MHFAASKFPKINQRVRFLRSALALGAGIIASA